MWLGSLVVEHRTGDREVAGSSVTYCTVKYSLGTPLTHMCFCHQYDLVVIEGR